jgi:hypothetical protein
VVVVVAEAVPLLTVLQALVVLEFLEEVQVLEEEEMARGHLVAMV